jgi:arylsulfatase A-like enzyme
MDLTSLLSEAPVADHPGPENHRRDRRGLIALLGLSAWCGTIAGLLEVVSVLVHKRFFDTNQILSMTRHFIWLFPLADLLIFLLAGFIGVLVVIIWPASGRWWVVRMLGTLTFLPMLLVAVPQVYGVAWLAVAVGLSSRLVPAVEQRQAAFRRFAVYTAPVLLLVVLALAAAPWAADWIEQRRELGRPLPADAPNILLIVMDTVAARHLDLYGYARPTSPAIDELARRGSRFDAAHPVSSWTLPSHAGMFTGRWPHELSVGWRTPLDAAAPTVAEFLGARGYATAGFIANTSYCGADTGLGRGFTVYRDYLFQQLSPFRKAVLIERCLDGMETIGGLLGEALDLTWLKRGAVRVREWFETDRKQASEVNREFLDWLTHRPQPHRPYFAFLNYFDAHSPYQIPPERVRRFGVKPNEEREIQLIRDWWTVDKSQVSPAELAFVADAYDDCVASIDEQVGRLCDELKRRKALDRTWIILVSDHGESFGEHEGVYVHGSSLYQTELHVPLVVVPPSGVDLKPVVTDTVSLRRLASTIVDLAGWGAESPFPGGSLARLWGLSPEIPGALAPDEKSMAELIPNETLVPGLPGSPRRPGPLSALTEDGWSLILRDVEVREELYHLRADASELHNLAADPSAQARLGRMRQNLRQLTGGPLTLERFNP